MEKKVAYFLDDFSLSELKKNSKILYHTVYALDKIRNRIFEDEEEVILTLEKEAGKTIKGEYLRYILKHMEKAPNELFSLAVRLEESYQYRLARELYQSAKELYKDYKPDNIFALICISANLTINKINAKKIKGIEHSPWRERIGETYQEILDDFLNEMKEAKEQLFKIAIERFKGYNLSIIFKLNCLELILSFFKKLEVLFQNEGLSDESLIIYKHMQFILIEKYRLLSKLPDKDVDRFRYKGKAFFLKFWGRIFGFGVDLFRMSRNTFFVIVTCWIFYSLGLIAYEDGGIPKVITESAFWENIGHSLYYSVVSITNLGSETHFPVNFLGRLIHTLEGLFGMIVFGAFIAFLTRRIK